MAAQLADKGHPALQTVPAESFSRMIEELKKETPPSERMLKLVANGRKSLQER